MWLNNTIQEHDTGAAAKPNKRWRHDARLKCYGRTLHAAFFNMRKRVYIETTIPSFYYEVRSTPDMVARRAWTRLVGQSELSL